MRKRYTGGCHCGAVRFEAELDLSEGTFKCNCSICTKKRTWGATAHPGTFQLLQGEGALGEYRPYEIHHKFCKHCGIHAFGWGDDANLGGKFYVVSVPCLDDVDINELVEAPITYFDGANDNYETPPAEVRHL